MPRLDVLDFPQVNLFEAFFASIRSSHESTKPADGECAFSRLQEIANGAPAR